MASTPPPDTPLWHQRLQERKVQTTSWINQRSPVLSWGGIIAGGLFITIAAWPLAITVWDFLGLSEAQTWRLTLCGLGALALATGVWGTNRKRTPPVRLIWLILAAWLVASATVTALTGFAWLLLETPRWTPPEELTPRHLESITTRAFAIVAGLGGVALLVIAYRRQRSTENGEQRETTKLFNERFTAAYTELGNEHAAVRLGAVHALAHLTDEAPSEREAQMVIDVLCAYLRMPYTPASESLPKYATKEDFTEIREQNLEYESFRELRHSIIRVIGDRLREPSRWRGKNFDFTGVVFDGGDLSHAHFTGGKVSFDDADFSDGTMNFEGANFTGAKVTFNRARFTGGTASFNRAKFTGGAVSFDDIQVIGGFLHFFRSEFIDGEISFNQIQLVSGGMKFSFSSFTGGKISFLMSIFFSGVLTFSAARFTGSIVHFDGTEFSGTTTTFHGTYFTGGAVSFNGTEFNKGEMSFGWAKFNDSIVHFEGTQFTGGRVDFSKAKGTPPVKLIESIKHGEAGVVRLPYFWNLTCS